jgi:DNA-binding LacI/PurR family transcriptional regulator
MNPSTRYTIDEIAAAAGVSKATVSRVMNGTAAVSDDRRKKVEATIKKFKYHPNPNARKLAGGIGGSIALVLEESTEEFFMNPFWKSVVQGFIDKASSSQLHPVLFFHSKEDSDEFLVQALVRGNFDGVAIFGWHRNINILEKYIPKNMSVVFGGNQGTSTRFTYVGVDNVAGGELATNKLIQAGCRKILTITGDLTVQSARERLEGYKNALAKSQIKFLKSYVLEGNFSRESAVTALRAALKKNFEFDGIFVANDNMAVGAIQVLKESGLGIPNQVKIIGFDGSELAKTVTPSLATIAQPSYELGNAVAGNLVAALNRLEINNIELKLRFEPGESLNSSKI